MTEIGEKCNNNKNKKDEEPDSSIKLFPGDFFTLQVKVIADVNQQEDY